MAAKEEIIDIFRQFKARHERGDWLEVLIAEFEEELMAPVLKIVAQMER